MVDEKISRKLTTILAADVAGYTRLMRADEEATLKTLGEYRELFDALIAGHGGRAFSTGGDSVLAEFGSAVEAVRCAVQIQEDLGTRNGELAEERRLQFRIGVNVGDVMVRNGDLFGDGINVAARLEGLAEAGGLCISGSVFEQIKHKLSLGFEDMGPQEVKNIAEPISAYRLAPGGGPIPAGVAAKPRGAKSWRVPAVAAAAVVVIVAGGGLALWQPWAPEFEPASVARMAFPLPDKPSIAILPFDNYSDDPKLDFFASGLTEDLTTSLSKVPGLFVISRNSATAYKGKPVDIRQVAEELGVQYVLEGSVQKAGEKLRINAQLVDALNGRHLWADRFDRPAGDVFALQDEIAKHVFVELQVKLTEGDHARVASRGTKSLKAWLLRIEAYDEVLKWTQEAHVRALELYRAAHAADPNWGWPLAGISIIHWYTAKRGWSESRAESIRLGIEFAERAIKIGPNEPLGYMARGNLFFLLNQPERAIELRRKAIELAPNSFAAVAGLAMRLKEHGREQEAIELFEKAIRLSPKHPWWVLAGYGLALHLVGRKEEAAGTYLKTIDLTPKNANLHARLAALYVDLGRIDEAKASAQETLRLMPKFSVSRYQKSYPLNDPKRVAWYKDLLLRAGLPE